MDGECSPKKMKFSSETVIGQHSNNNGCDTVNDTVSTTLHDSNGTKVEKEASVENCLPLHQTANEHGGLVREIQPNEFQADSNEEVFDANGLEGNVCGEMSLVPDKNQVQEHKVGENCPSQVKCGPTTEDLSASEVSEKFEMVTSPKPGSSSEVYSNSGRPMRRCRTSLNKDSGPYKCPCCKAVLLDEDAEVHLSQEMQQLHRWHAVGRNKHKSGSQRTSLLKNRSGLEDLQHLDRQKVLKSVQRNRRNRQKKTRSDVTECPVCCKPITGSAEELNSHVNECLNQESQELDVETTGSSDDECLEELECYEQYEWAGQTRIRATSMLSSLQDLGSRVTAVSQRTSGDPAAEDELEELDIDGDDSEIFGPTQFTEADLIPCGGHAQSEAASTSREPSVTNDALDVGAVALFEDRVPEELLLPRSDGSCQPSPSSCRHLLSSGSEASQVRALKARIEELEQNTSPSAKCSVCMGSFRTPVTSIQCWHVYCEECWLQSLGTKKLCPQCSMITHPKDLRKIYF